MFSVITNIYNKKTKGPIFLVLLTPKVKMHNFPPPPPVAVNNVLIILHQWSCSNSSNLLLHKLKANVYDIPMLLRKRFGHSAPTPRRAFAEPATGSIIFRKIHTLLQPVTANIIDRNSVTLQMEATCSSERSVPTYKPTRYKNLRRLYYEYYDTKNLIILWCRNWIIGIYCQNPI
jgi:hypothetical protein